MRRPMMKEMEEELAMFLEMSKREKERDNLLLQNADDFDAPLGSKPGTSPIFNITSPPPSRRTGTDDFLNADNDKNDYDWYLNIIKDEGLEISQPALDSTKSEVHHPLTARQRNLKFHSCRRLGSTPKKNSMTPGRIAIWLTGFGLLRFQKGYILKLFVTWTVLVQDFSL